MITYKMKVLVACEFSGIVRDAFIARGHDAWSCDLSPTEKEGPHIQDDVLKYLDCGWDLMIAHPPCTYLSNAGACRLYPKKGCLDQERYRKGLLAKEFFMLLLNAPINKIAVENPVSSSIFKLPLYSQEVQPYMFGHPYTKKTRFWLKGLPKLIGTNLVRPVSPFLPSGTGRKDRSKYGVARQGNDRSRTFIGIAQAMAKQWG